VRLSSQLAVKAYGRSFAFHCVDLKIVQNRKCECCFRVDDACWEELESKKLDMVS
jgi:hypothetical protein